MTEHYLIDKQTGFPVAVIDADELQRRAACIALRCIQAVSLRRRVAEVLPPLVAEYSRDTRPLLLTLVICELLAVDVADTLKLALELRPQGLDGLRKRALSDEEQE